MRRDPAQAETLRQVRAIYDEWQQRPLARNCTGLAQCCRFRLTGRIPYLTRGEALLAARAWRAAGRKSLPLPNDGSCPLLDPHTGLCRIYPDRPFGCRTHFCAAAGGDAPRAAVRDLIQRLEAIDSALGGSGAVNLPAALTTALQGLK